MFLQVRYMIKAPLGYNTTNIIDINGMELPDEQTCFTLMNELKQLASVDRVGAGLGTPFNMGMNYTARYADGKKISFQMLRCDKSYADILGFEFLRDNHVANSSRYYLTESAMRALELPTMPVPSTFPTGAPSPWRVLYVTSSCVISCNKTARCSSF